MTKSFTYSTKTTDKEVILFDSEINGKFLVEVNDSCQLYRSVRHRFNTYSEAEKKFNSIKKRVLK